MMVMILKEIMNETGEADVCIGDTVERWEEGSLEAEETRRLRGMNLVFGENLLAMQGVNTIVKENMAGWKDARMQNGTTGEPSSGW